MLIDQYDANVFPLGGEVLECMLDRGVLSLGIDDQEILLRIRRLGDVLPHPQELAISLAYDMLGRSI